MNPRPADPTDDPSEIARLAARILADHCPTGLRWARVAVILTDLTDRDTYMTLPGLEWTGNGVLDRFLEDESLFGEFLRTPVSEGGVESLVVEPPHIVVEVGA